MASILSEFAALETQPLGGIMITREEQETEKISEENPEVKRANEKPPAVPMSQTHRKTRRRGMNIHKTNSFILLVVAPPHDTL